MTRLARIALGALIGIVTVTLVAYAGDSLIFRLRSSPTSSVTVRPYLVVPRKDARVEFMFEEPREQSRVNALFPHQQQWPCWYLRRHTEQKTNL